MVFSPHLYPAGSTTDGQLATYNASLYNIWISQSMLNTASKDYITAVLIHESIHAYIVRMRPSSFPGGGGDGMDSSTFAQHFPIYMQNSTASAQHYEMATNYVAFMKNIIQGLNPSLTNYNAEALAWGGLEMTTVWKSRADSIQLVLQGKTAKYTGETFLDSTGTQVNYATYGYVKCP